MQKKKYFGNIITDYRKEKFPPFFNVTNSYEERNDNIPTLIIGLEEAKNNISNFSILKKQYENRDIWWTYKKTERKYDFDMETEEFFKHCFKKFFSDIKYIYFNIPKLRYTDFKKILNWYNSENNKTCFLTRDSNFLFTYDSERNIVFGLSLTLCEYIGIEKKKIINKIKRNKKNTFLYSTDFIDKNVRELIRDNPHYILPLADIFQS